MKYATKESAMKWLDQQIAAEERRNKRIYLSKDVEIGVCGVATTPNEGIHIYQARNAVKLANLIEVEYEIHDPWCEQFTDRIEVQFYYRGWRFHGIDMKEEWENEKAEIAD